MLWNQADGSVRVEVLSADWTKGPSTGGKVALTGQHAAVINLFKGLDVYTGTVSGPEEALSARYVLVGVEGLTQEFERIGHYIHVGLEENYRYEMHSPDSGKDRKEHAWLIIDTWAFHDQESGRVSGHITGLIRSSDSGGLTTGVAGKAVWALDPEKKNSLIFEGGWIRSSSDSVYQLRSMIR
jgi:hypothetical protein